MTYQSDNPQFDHLINNMDSEEIPYKRPEPDDRPDWHHEGFNSLREAENAWQCQAESDAEERGDRG